MIGRVAVSYALRSLWRNPRRSVLSMLGAGIGTALGLLATSWASGAAEMQIRAVAESGAGHIRVVSAEWPETRENALRLAEYERAVAAVGAMPGVRRIAARARANGLLAFGNRTAAVEISGVDPIAESSFNRIITMAKLEGRYLQPGDREHVVIGRELAKRLRVRLDDDLMVTVAGKEELNSAMLRVVGLLETGSRDIDSGICHVTLKEIDTLAGRPGPAEIAVLLDDYHKIDDTRTALRSRLPAGSTAITWKESNPELAGNVEGDRAFTRLLILIIVVVVALGIASAQLTAVLERRREFGVLAALGMKGRQLLALILLESALVGVGGAVVALVLAGPVTYWLATHGVNIGDMMNGLSIGNVLFDPIVYGDFGAWVIGYAFAVAVGATLAASLLPARFATKADPAQALRAA
ncbi:MAG: FtsX-like permease family protein [Pseudomonadota bacterium]